MADPTPMTPLQSLEVMHRIVEKVPMSGEERDACRWHSANISKALQPKDVPDAPTDDPAPTGGNGV